MRNPFVTDRIVDFFTAESILQKKEIPWDSVVSITDPERGPPKSLEYFEGPKIHLAFADLPEGWEDGPESHHVKELIEFLQDPKVLNGNTLFHCVAGISRSSAAALIKCVLRRKTENLSRRETSELAVEDLLKIKRDVFPNQAMVSFADEILNLEGTLVDKVILQFGY